MLGFLSSRFTLFLPLLSTAGVNELIAASILAAVCVVAAAVDEVLELVAVVVVGSSLFVVVVVAVVVVDVVGSSSVTVVVEVVVAASVVVVARLVDVVIASVVVAVVAVAVAVDAVIVAVAPVFVSGTVVARGMGTTEGNVGPKGSAQLVSVTESFLLIMFSKGVYRSSIISPESSQIMKPCRLSLMTYSVLRQIARSSSKETRPPSLKNAYGVEVSSCQSTVRESICSMILKY